LPDLERAAALAPDNAGVQLALARTRVALGELGRARAQVDLLLRGAPTYPGALELDSELRRRRGDADGALAAARRAVELRPDRFEAQLVLAKALAVAGDRAAARVALERAGALAPDDPDVAKLRRSLAE